MLKRGSPAEEVVEHSQAVVEASIGILLAAVVASGILLAADSLHGAEVASSNLLAVVVASDTHQAATAGLDHRNCTVAPVVELMQAFARSQSYYNF